MDTLQKSGGDTSPEGAVGGVHWAEYHTRVWHAYQLGMSRGDPIQSACGLVTCPTDAPQVNREPEEGRCRQCEQALKRGRNEKPLRISVVSMSSGESDTVIEGVAQPGEEMEPEAIGVASSAFGSFLIDQGYTE